MTTGGDGADRATPDGRHDDVIRLCLAMLAGDVPMDRPDPATGMVPVGVQRIENMAVAAVAEFGPDHEAGARAVFVRDGDGWRPVRGGGLSGGGDGTNRPVAARIAAWSRRPAPAEWDGDLLRQDSGGATTAIPRRAAVHGKSYVTSVIVRAASGVDHVLVDDARREIPWHGRVLVAWLVGSRRETDDLSGERRIVPALSPRPEIVAVSATGARFRLPADPRQRYR